MKCRPTVSAKSTSQLTEGSPCAEVNSDKPLERWWDEWFSEMRTSKKEENLVHLVQIEPPPLAFELSLWMWADKLTEGEDNHKALLSDVPAEPNLRLDRSTEGSALVLRGGVVCMGGWVVVLGGGIVIVVLVGLNVAVGKQKRSGWCLGAVQQVRDRRKAAIPLDKAVPTWARLWRGRQDTAGKQNRKT